MARQSSSRLLLPVVLLACFAVTRTARADNIVPLYTGTFNGILGDEGWNGVSMLFGIVGTYDSSTVNFNFVFSGPISDFQETPWCGFGCPQYATGIINAGQGFFNGSNSSGQDPYSFTGTVLPGGTFSGEVVCDRQSCAWDDSITLSFSGSPGTNGWFSNGQLTWSGGNDGYGGDGGGSLTMRTFASPEPGSLVMLFSGALGCGFLRRFRRRI